ncbi:hypothetical protein M8818_001599 [Zalaria obscura]|uniref:Uncharacterized protein n=1 Tax=Zalaria obscura TaxID=2024903 RepID=A0ACC3SL59_9PEZI
MRGCWDCLGCMTIDARQQHGGHDHGAIYWPSLRRASEFAVNVRRKISHVFSPISQLKPPAFLDNLRSFSTPTGLIHPPRVPALLAKLRRYLPWHTVRSATHLTASFSVAWYTGGLRQGAAYQVATEDSLSHSTRGRFTDIVLHVARGHEPGATP